MSTGEARVTGRRGRIHTRHRVMAVAIALAILVVPHAAQAQNDSRRERDRVRAQQAELASKLNVMKADQAQIADALHTLDVNVSRQQKALAAAQAAVVAAEQALSIARSEEQAAMARLAALQQALKELAVNAYVRPPDNDSMNLLSSAGSLTEVVQKQALMEVRANHDLGIIDQTETARQDLESKRQAAEAASAQAAAAKQSVEGKLHELEAAQDQQQQLAAAVEQSIDAALSDSAALSAMDKKLSAQIAAEEAAARARSAGGISYSTGGNISLATVRGITVNAAIASQLGAMLDAAAADGIVLGGGGYRSPAGQIAVRKANCGTSDYAIYQMPASSCSPPTAPPGTSMHEQGLAIDFTYGGGTIGSRSSPAYQWLARNAASYGFYNLPSEPWHWSVNGR